MEKTVYWIEGDGIGPDVWKAGRPVIDAAVAKAYGDGRRSSGRNCWPEARPTGKTGEYLPEATLAALRGAELAFKGPLATPVGGGFRSLNVTMRQVLDLYACIRPIRYFPGIESPVKHPERVDMIIFRENTEDVYAGIEYASGTVEAKKIIALLRDEFGAKVDPSAGIGIKPITPAGSKRLVRKAIRHAVTAGLPSVTLVHKGNIMKYTEGAFRAFGYEVAATEFADTVMTEAEAAAGGTKAVIIKDRIADNMFQVSLMHPEDYSVIATTNLNGDYISDALAAQVGGLGLAPGVNMSESLAFFEPTHGTAPAIAGKDMANPGSLILSGAMLLEHIGWHEAAARIHASVAKTIQGRKVTTDLADQIPGATTIGCAAFGEIVERNL